MAKLTRHTSFETLKAAAQHAKKTSAEDIKSQAEFEAFVKASRQQLAARKKVKTSDEQ